MQMKTFVAVALAMIFLFARAGLAQTNQEITQAMGEVAGELQQCNVYFLVLSFGPFETCRSV